MGWSINPEIASILEKGASFEGISRTEALKLLELDLESREVYALMATADSMSRQAFGNKGENHFHIGLNVAPCPMNCSFCSLTVKSGIFTDNITFSQEQILQWAKLARQQGADALNLMTTGNFPFSGLLETGRILKQEVDIALVANTRDINHKEGEALLEAGFVGAYHAVRLGEGRDTPFDREKRIATIKVFKDVGLQWMNCIEPVGPEHSHQEIIDLMFLARKYRATYSGVMRRINFPGSPMAKYGMISERELARMVAVSRLVMGSIARAHCTHEPNQVSLIAGANLIFPEVGSSPRDGCADTAQGRGHGLQQCRQILNEMGWNPDLHSNCFS